MQVRNVCVVLALAAAAFAVPAMADTQRPMKGSLEGYDEYGVCAGGTLITSYATGTMTHMGKTMLISPVCVGPDFLPIGMWTFTLTAANGDEVRGVVTNFVFTDYGFDLFATITDGTGRFTGATGELTMPTVSDGSGTWSSEIEGWIIY